MSHLSSDHLALIHVSPLRRTLAWMEQERIGPSTLMALAWGLSVLAASVLLWAGVTHGWTRAILLILAAIAAYARWFATRLGDMAPAYAQTRTTHVGRARRWSDLLQEAFILLAAGFSAFGSGLFFAPIVAAVPAAMLLAGGWLARRNPDLTAPPRPDPVLVLAAFGVASGLEALVHWRGQVLVIGLCAVSVILGLWLRRLTRREPA